LRVFELAAKVQTADVLINVSEASPGLAELNRKLRLGGCVEKSQSPDSRGIGRREKKDAAPGRSSTFLRRIVVEGEGCGILVPFGDCWEVETQIPHRKFPLLSCASRIPVTPKSWRPRACLHDESRPTAGVDLQLFRCAGEDEQAKKHDSGGVDLLEQSVP
jgi:hypothetical protein